MNRIYFAGFLLVSLMFLSTKICAQTPWDAIFMGKQQLCIAAMYDHASFTEYWEGEQLVTNGNIGTFRKNSFLPMIAYGIVDGLDIIAMVPYISTYSTEGQLAGVSGFQDLSLVLKARAFQKEVGNGSIALIGALSFATPVGSYLSDYMPYSLGMGCNEFGIRGTVEYQINKSFYARASAAHLWRGYSEVERDYYYQEGSHYTTFMRVPNAWNLHGALGWLHLDGRLRVELTYLGIKCTSGDDIRRWLRPQPTNKVMFDQVGAFVQYYFKNFNQVSLIGYANQMFSGRNMGKFTNFTVGATYQIGIKRPTQIPN